MTAASELQAAIAVFDKSAERTTPNAQTAAWATIKPALLAALKDAERLDWLDTQRADDVHQEPGGEQTLESCWWILQSQNLDLRAAIDAALASGGGVS